MSGNVVFVTSTDYVTIYSSASAHTTIPPPSSTMIHSATIDISSTAMSIISSKETPCSMSNPKGLPVFPHSSMTGIPPLPSEFATPTPQFEPRPEPKPWNDHIAVLAIIAIIMCALVLLAFIGYAIYTRFKGRCSACETNEAKLEKWEKGELKVITKEMVKARETLSTQPSERLVPAPTGSNIDLERGEMVSDYQTERQAAHEAALAVLNAPELAYIKPSFWDRAKSVVRSRGKAPQVASQSLPARAETPPNVGERLFTVVEPEPAHRSHEQTLPQIPTFKYEPSITHNPAFEPPSPSIYSRATHSNAGRPQSEHYNPDPPRSPSSSYYPTTYSTYLGKVWGPRNEEHMRQQEAAMRDEGSVVSSTLNVNNYRHLVRYDQAQRTMQRNSTTESEMQRAVDVVNTVEGQMRKKRRSRTYGGLPIPEEFEDVER